ncbi:MAG: sugar kinase [Rhizobiales bacterium]|nr:sugar kinase [Hyphomicrobiales bacterium]
MNERYHRWMRRFGPPLLLLSWLPVVGDPFCTLAGWLRLSWRECLFFIAVGKTLRYVAVTFLMLRVPGRLPGLCIVETGAKGERRFRSWRGEAPARELFELPDWNRIAESMISARLIYFSGITLSLYSNAGLGRLLAIVEVARQQGAKVAFDGNFRPHGWKGDLPRTRTVFVEALKRVDVAMPAFDDEAVLWGDPSPEATVERLQAFGIAEIVVKNGPNSALVAAGGHQEFIPPAEIVEPIDTTAAGDSFNAAYIAARLAGENPALAAAAGHKLAAEKVRHRGAIMPRNAAAVH